MKPIKWTLDAIARATQRADDLLHRDTGVVVLEGFEPSMQADRFSCGAQSAFMVLRWFGRARSIDAVMRELGTSAEGTDDHDIVRLLMARGLRLRMVGRMSDLENAVRTGSPALVCLDGADGHYAVVYGLSRGYVRLADPSWIRSPRTLVTRAVSGSVGHVGVGGSSSSRRRDHDLLRVDVVNRDARVTAATAVGLRELSNGQPSKREARDLAAELCVAGRIAGLASVCWRDRSYEHRAGAAWPLEHNRGGNCVTS